MQNNSAIQWFLRAKSEASIQVDLVDSHGKEVRLKKTIKNRGQNETVESVDGDGAAEHIPLVAAFGVARANEGPDQIRRIASIADSAYMLFNYEATFTSPELTFRRLNDFVGLERFDEALARIKEALGLEVSDKIEFVKGGGIDIKGSSHPDGIPLIAWADGYRITLNLLADVYAWAMRFNGALDEEGDVKGILIVDEIEQHLHPRMQRRVVSSVRSVFPKMQLIASSHSPALLFGLDSHETVSLHKVADGIVAREVREYWGYSIEDLYTADELFGMPPYSPSVERHREEYKSLVLKGDLNDCETRRLRELARALGRLGPPDGEFSDEHVDRLSRRLAELENDSD